MTDLRCSVFIAMSLDGYIADVNGGTEFLEAVEAPGEDYGYAEFINTIDAIVLGRKTYETVLAFPSWLYTKRVIVLTSDVERTSHHGEEFSAASPTELVERLAQERLSRLYIDGGATIRSFLAAGLIDDLVVSVIPVLLGEGIPLFGPGFNSQLLQLTGSQSFDSGLAQLSYAVVSSG